jgi:hypothetical protein
VQREYYIYIYIYIYIAEQRLSELVTNVGIIENSNNWIKLLSTKKHYITVIMYCTIIIIKTEKLFKQAKHE